MVRRWRPRKSGDSQPSKPILGLYGPENPALQPAIRRSPFADGALDQAAGEGLNPRADGAAEAEFASRQKLLALLESEYDRLLERLVRALRSPDAASEALHDVYLKLGSDAEIGDVRHPVPYLYRMAINLAKNRRRHETFLKAVPTERIDEIPDQAPSPERIAGDHLEMERALAALEALPAQRREIFLARWRDDKLLTEIAGDFGLHKRTVQKELTRAEQYLRSALGR